MSKLSKAAKPKPVWRPMDVLKNVNMHNVRFLEKDYSSFRFYKAGIFNKYYLTNKHGRYKGYPFRSFADGGFTDGFSDHFPVYIYLIKEVTAEDKKTDN